jgi:uncharacterized protein
MGLMRLKLGKKGRERIYRFVLIVFLILNILAFAGAYLMTHSRSPEQFGLGLPRDVSSNIPTNIGLSYSTQRIPVNQTEWLETWFIPVRNSTSNGTILMFPGKSSSKASQLLAPAKAFNRLSYDTLLVDFRGVGGSSGNTHTLGIREAKDVALAMSYAQSSKLKRPFILYGISMGSAAVLRAIAIEKVNPDAMIIELPFARLLDSVRSRLRAMWFPSFPMAELIVFWGGVQHGVNGFDHNPETYASQVKSPTLLMQGKLDQWTSLEEINHIFKNLPSSKQLLIFPNTGHSLLVTVDKEYWQQNVDRFLSKVNR